MVASKHDIKHKLPVTRESQPCAKRLKQDPGSKATVSSSLEKAQDMLAAGEYRTAFYLLVTTFAAASNAVVIMEVARYIFQQEIACSYKNQFKT